MSIVSMQLIGQSKTLKGRILADSIEETAINIINLNKEKGTVSDANGYFEIEVEVGDMLYFSSIQYEVFEKEITEKDFLQQELKIVLLPKINELEEVRISNVKLSGDLIKDATNVKVKPFIQASNFGISQPKKKPLTQAERRLYTAKTSSGGVPLDLMLNLISGRLKKLKIIKALEDKEQKVQKGENAFRESFFINDLKISKELISDFVHYCSEDYHYENLLKRNKKLSLLEFFQEKATIYKELKKKEGVKINP